MENNCLYRFVDQLTIGNHVVIYLREYLILRETRCGFWISYPNSKGEKFILKKARKRFAWPAKEEALKSFIARKRSQIRILESQLRSANSALRKGITMLELKSLEDIKHGW